jgi:cytochrome c553
MYSNLIREEDYPLLQKDGILKHATYTTVHEITEENEVEAGRNVFMLTCSRCHTSRGVNSIVDVFEKMYGKGKSLSADAMAAYIPSMHNGRAFMPPFPGNETELKALARYIKHLQVTHEPLIGAQTEGITVNPLNNSVNVVKALESSAEITQEENSQQ